MWQAIQYLEDVSRRMDGHDLFAWMTSSRHRDHRRHFDNFIPVMNFILMFPFYNDRYLRYDLTKTESMEKLRETINNHAAEDETHARLFLRDIKQLDLERVWGMNRPSTGLWSLFLSPMLSPIRKVLGERIRCVVQSKNEWPPFRYVQMEELEAFGNRVFTASTTKSNEVKEQHGIDPIYFGQFHLERESGHVEGGESFKDFELSPDQRDHARGIVDWMHAATMTMIDNMHEFATKAEALEKPAALLANEKEERLARVHARLQEHLAGKVPLPTWRKSSRTALSVDSAHPSQVEVVKAWQRHHEEFLNHPFAGFLHDLPDADVAFGLRCAALLFAPRISSLYDFYKFDCAIDPEVKAPGTEVLQFLAGVRATQSELFFHDWDVLGMDDRLPWNLTELFEWIFFDPTYGRPEMESLHEFRRETLRFDNDPLIKYWALMSASFMARAFFRETSALAKRFADANPDRLPLAYMGNLRHLLHYEATENWIDPDHPTQLSHLPMSPEQREYVLNMMDVYARCGRRQFDNLARAVTEDRKRFEFLR